MAEGVVSVSVKKLCELIQNEAYLLARVEPDVKLLRQKLEWISLSLKEADEKCPEDEQIRLWVAQVREAAFEAEDIIDDFVLQSKKNLFKRAKAFRKIGKKIQGINLRLDKISENRLNLGIRNVQDKGEPSVPIIRTGRRSAKVEEVDIVGIEDEVKIISTMLTGGDARRCVVSILGMGGLGKTTLANKVLNDVKRNFQCYAWVSVSQEFTVRDLLYDLIKCVKTLSSDDIIKLKSMKEEELSGELFNCLKGKHYFIVIDDIWSKEAWDGIQASFPAENKGSRILITTRIRDVAKYADPTSNPYELRLLKDEECWELLLKKAFRKVSNHVNVHLEELKKVGMDIAKGCNGLPLAAVVLGGLLSTKDQSIHEWRMVLKAIDWHIKEGQGKILPILALSYNDLPYYLKMCFLSFAAFPEDSNISATELIRMWVAEGFVQERGDQTPEEVAEDHLLELIHRSLIQVAKRRCNGRVNECRIHDLLRDLAIEKAKENQFLNVYRRNEGPASPTTARRLSVTRGDICQHMHVDRLTKHSRSLFCFFQLDAPFGSKNWKSLYKCFRLLRVLHMDNVPSCHAIPDGIGDLIHLRYLYMRFQGEMRTFPSTIYNLYNLQSLYFYSVWYDVVPLLVGRGLWKMKQLRHLDTGQPLWLPKAKHVKLNELTNLQTVSLMLSGDWIKSDFDKLTSLRELGLQGQMTLYQTALSSFIGKQENLESLWLTNTLYEPTQFISSHLHHLRKLFLHGRFERLSTLQEFAPSLIELDLHRSKLLEDSMAVLEKLPKLQFLTLFDVYSNSVKKMSCSTKGFPMLESFIIESCGELENWAIKKGAFANLRYLRIVACPKLKMIPEGLQHVTTLQELVLSCQPEFCERVRKNGLDWFKIQHVQFVEIESSY